MSPRILVVDDDADALIMLQLILQRRGFEVLTANSGPKALGLLTHDVPDLIVLDVMMPQMDGNEVCRKIKADPRTTHLPIIMLTAKAEAGAQMEGLRAGADDYIAKPVHPDELVQHIRTVLERLAAAPAEKTARVVSVLGAKGGVGATTLAVNLALAWAGPARVVLADWEPSGTAAIHLGLDPLHGLDDLLAREAEAIDRASVEAALTPHSSGLRLLAAAAGPMDPARSNAILNHLLPLCDMCVFDLGGDLNPAAHTLGQRSSDLILVLNSDRATLAQARRMARSLGEADLAFKPVWVNHLGTPDEVARPTIRMAVGQNPVAAIGPASEALYAAMERGRPLVLDQPDHPVAAQMRALAASLWPSS